LREAALTQRNRQGHQLLRTTPQEAIPPLQAEARAAQPIHQGRTALHLQDHPLHITPDQTTLRQAPAEAAILQVHQAAVIHLVRQAGAIPQVVEAVTQEALQVAAHHQAAEGKGN